MQYNYSVKLKNPRSVFCPVMKAEMSIHSEEVLEIGFFSKILIWAIGIEKGYSKQEIAEITGMPLNIVDDEASYLSKIGLVEELDQPLNLTELGNSFYRKVVAVETFNDLKEQVLINCVSGEIIANNANIIKKQEISANEIVLSQRIIPDLYGNLNPSNSKEFLLENFDLSPLSLEEKSLLDVSLKLLFEKDREKKVFIHFKTKHVPFILHGGMVNEVDGEQLVPREERPIMEETHSLLPFMYPMQKGKLRITNLLLDPYRYVLSTLDKLEQFEGGLISDKAVHLLELFQEEQRIQHQLSMEIYFDCVSGILTTALDPSYRREKNIRNEVEILPNYKIEDILIRDFAIVLENLTSLDVDNTDWELGFEVEEEFYLKVNENPANIFSMG
ncbi:hypothetical protein IQ781_06205 [Bacillus sp. N447-1]|uniref:hypothetical protein n=1 Tax=Bacillus TaxID=1386 RepID=UPI001F607D06|nr:MULTISPECIES: hypothetical protein [Bacillus]HDR4425394.1 hypothetical protein [Bacillus cereus]MDA2145833.1 hypothetical protein [Bacillus cereus group sp. Bc248]MDA2173683.1 hypothetical protein [Bacillus cereus group sp. Bc247]MDA2664052.1 hypothetical protein [Bacillus cereus group sp. Bc032]MDA2674770.1 hypothetical protein [Bacillus cereus group sp. Bc031]